MVLRQPDMDFGGVKHPNHTDSIVDWQNSEDMPASWEQIVVRCRSRDPTERPDVLGLPCFWEDECSNLAAKNNRG